MEDLELIERYFRRELNPDESARFNERLMSDPAFKRKFDTETLVHKAIQFSRERETLMAYPATGATSARPAAEWLDNKGLLAIAGTALVVWIISTFSSSVTNLAPQYIKWIGVIVSIGASFLLVVMSKKTMDGRGMITGIFNGLLVFVIASGVDAINQGAKGIAGKEVTEAHLIPFTADKPWWPTQSLEDSLASNRKRIMEMGEQIRALVGSRLSSGPIFNFGLAAGKFTPVVIARSSAVESGANYEADIFLATSPVRQTIEMRLDGKPIPLEAEASGVKKGKVSFKATADQFDYSGKTKKKFVVEIVVGDSTYRRVVEYLVTKSK
jgi:hypothetical protein